MSYLVPRDKPKNCIDCIFLDKNYRDCRLQKIDYCDFNKQYKNCPLVDVMEGETVNWLGTRIKQI